MMVPIVFTSDHIETLHEMDLEYAEELGQEVGTCMSIGGILFPRPSPYSPPFKTHTHTHTHTLCTTYYFFVLFSPSKTKILMSLTRHHSLTIAWVDHPSISSSQ